MFEEEEKVLDSVLSNIGCDVKLPLGQACLAAGFKPITNTQIMERFACGKITEREKKNAYARLLARHPGGERQIVDCGSHYDYVQKTRWLDILTGNYRSNVDWEYWPICQIQTQSLKTYVNEKIPDECLLLVKKAQEIGVSEFSVCYPVLKSSALNDPIIIGILRNNDNFRQEEIWVEIAMWE
jgi:hypothetical protein